MTNTELLNKTKIGRTLLAIQQAVQDQNQQKSQSSKTSSNKTTKTTTTKSSKPSQSNKSLSHVLTTLRKTKTGAALAEHIEKTIQKAKETSTTSTTSTTAPPSTTTKTTSKDTSSSKPTASDIANLQALASNPILGKLALSSSELSPQEQAIQEKMKHAPSVLTNKGKREWAERQLEKEKTTAINKYGALASEYETARQQRQSYFQSFKSSLSTGAKNIAKLTQYQEQIESKIEEVSQYKGNKNIVWTTPEGKEYTTEEYLALLEKERERILGEKKNVYRTLGETQKSFIYNYPRLSSYERKIKGYIEKGYYGVKEGDKLKIYPSKKAYEKEQFIEKEKEYTLELHRKAEKGDLGANLELLGRGLVTSLGSWEGASRSLKWWINPSMNLQEDWYKKEGETFGKIRWEWEHTDILGKGGMMLESPGGILATAPVGGFAIGKGVGALSRIAPTAGRITKVGLGAVGIASAGMVGYDVVQTAVIQKKPYEAATKGLVYGSSFLFAAKMYKSAYKSGYRKAHVWWSSRHKPTFETIITKKIPTKEGIVFEGFEKGEWQYSIGRKITTTVHFRGIQGEKYTYTFGKGVGTMRYGYFKPKADIFEIRPFISVAETEPSEYLIFNKGAKMFIKGSKFTTIYRGGVSTGIVEVGREHPTVFYLQEEGKPRIIFLDKKYISRSVWARGVTLEKGRGYLPFDVEGVVSEKRGFTIYGKEGKPDFLKFFKGKPSGNLNTLYQTKTTTKVVTVTKPMLETGYLPEKFTTSLVPILVSKKITIRPFSQVSKEPKFEEMKGYKTISGEGLQLLTLTKKKSVTKTKQKQRMKQILDQKLDTKQIKELKMKQIQDIEKKQLLRTKQILDQKLKTGQSEKEELLSLSLQEKALLKKVVTRQKTYSVTETKAGSLLLTDMLSTQLQDVLSKEKVIQAKRPMLSSMSLQIEETILKTTPVTPITTPPILHGIGEGKPKKRKGKTTKKKKPRKKKKSKRHKKTLLAEPFSVQESQIRFGKATHPKPTKKIWEMGFKTGWKIPTVELMKKKSKKRKKRRLL